MKTTAVEKLRMVESVLFWSAALPTAVMAWPILLLFQKTKQLVHASDTSVASKHLTPRVA